MVKEEKTIDGFTVRSAKDSRLVAKSQASKISANKKKVSVSPKTTRATSTPKASTKVVAKAPKKVATARTGRGERSVRVQKAVSKRPTAAEIAHDSERATQKLRVARVKHVQPKQIQVQESHDIEESHETEAERDERIIEAHEDFLAPVESFNFSANEAEDDERDENETSEGRVEEVDETEVASMKQSKKELKEAKKRAKLEQKKGKKKHKVVIIILILLLLLLIGAGVGFYLWGNGLLKKLTGGEGDVWSAIGAMTNETYEPLKTDENGRTNILVFGTSGYNMSGESYGGYEHDGSQLTDSIMVVSLDQETGDVAMVSLPRDLYAMPTCTATGKINEVYWCSLEQGEDENGAANALQAKVTEILGLKTQYYVHINWGALVGIVDTLGGVTVTLDEDINDYGWTNAQFSAGVPTTINGEEALGLARARHGTVNGDFTRGNSQQKLIIAIKDRIVEKGLGITEGLSIMSSLGDNVRTNFGMAEVKTGMHLLEQFDLESMRQIPLISEDANYMTTATINGISYVVPTAGAGVYSSLKEYVRSMINDSPVEREVAKLEVLNGSEEAGVASAERVKLEAEGFKVTEIGDVPEGEWTGVTVFDASEGLKPETKKALEKYYGVEMKEMSELPAGVSPIGYDFIVIIGE